TTGAAPGESVRAAVTVAFGAAKRGLLLFPGRERAGRVVVVEVGFPPIEPEERGAEVLTPEWVAARLPRIPPNAHKGVTGAVTVVAGREGVAGASVMAAMGALRAGAGLVRVVAPESNRTILQTAVPEALFVDRSGSLDEALGRADAILAGPGMGTDDESLALVRRVLAQDGVRILLDADALTLLARHPDLLPADAAERVLLTPHPGEMGRLLGRDTAELVADPFAAAEEGVRRFGCALLLKGSPSLISSPGRPTLANSTGTSGVATGGMGDTLAGVVSGFLGAGATPRDAAALGVFLCGRAAEIADRGRSLLPRDVAEALPLALARPARADRLPSASVLFDLPAAE
ncbi:MAG TPA: NAD(P)H-hydrate dehydratase, partial [Longimicrobiaceae bacterium]|nr:NAD(P)H-hydrate dehydratase [Longimicrobiaceae bacterium]